MRRRRATVVDARPTEQLAAATALLESGMPAEQAWRAAGVQVDGDGIPQGLGGAVAAAARMSRDTGMPLVGVLRRVMDVLIARDEAADARDAALAGPRISARILMWLPAVGLAFTALLDLSAVALLVTTPLGWILVALAAGLTVAGWRWMSRLLDSAAPSEEAVPPAIVLALTDASLASGATVAAALSSVAAVVGGNRGEVLASVATDVGFGRAWDDAWGERADIQGDGAAADDLLARIRGALAPSVAHGASASPGLRAAIESVQRHERRESQRRAGELGVKLALPLALCLLPAFVVVGVLPMILGIAASVELPSLATQPALLTVRAVVHSAS